MKLDFERFFDVFNEFRVKFLDHVPHIIVAAFVLIVFLVIATLVKRIFIRLHNVKYIGSYVNVALLVGNLIYVSILVFGFFWALSILGLEQPIEKFLAGAGVVGIIAGFALKDITSNIFSGFLVDIQRPYKIGDWVEIDGRYGVIKKIGWVATQIRTVAGQQAFIPNQIVYNGTFTNYSAIGQRRVILESGVSYGDDLERVQAVALDEINKIPFVMKNTQIDFYFTGIGSSTYNFMVRFWIRFKNNDDYNKGMHEAIVRLKRRFEEEDISIAYNVTTLDFGVKGGVGLFDDSVRIKQSD